MMDKDYLYQIDIREWIERGLDADIMVPVSGNKIDKKYDISYGKEITGKKLY